MRTMMGIVMIALLSPSLAAQPTRDDQSDTLLSYFQFEDTSPYSYLLTYVPSLFIEHGLDLKAFIRGKTFQQIRKQFGDLRAMDAIYIRAMNLTDKNTAMALFLSAACTFDHQIVGLKIPIFAIYFPLSNESDKEFQHRVRNLPARLYADSPPTHSGDRDKLQHFFGSALLSYIFESREPAERIGNFVEEGEDAFIVDGVLDDRDARANRQGQEFGIALLNNNLLTPSQFLKFQLATTHVDAIHDAQCSGVW